MIIRRPSTVFILGDNSILVSLNASWCSIRLMGARALAKCLGDNNKLLKLDLSNNSFMNDTVEQLTESLTRNMILQELNLASNEFFCRYDTRIKGDPSILLIGKEASIYRMFVAAATNQALKIFRVETQSSLHHIRSYQFRSEKIISIHVV